jgi:hypothetical protein
MALGSGRAPARPGPLTPHPRRYAVSLNSSRPINARRISDVPPRISYNFASRSNRPVGNSLIYPLPPSAWIASRAIQAPFSAAYKTAPTQVKSSSAI